MTRSRSRTVLSAQSGPHPRLDEVVRKHLQHPWTAPVHAGSRAAFDAFHRWRDPSRPLVVDAGCGTALSTSLLARRHPGAQVLGIDRSAARLARAPAPLANELRIRARLEDAWRLLQDASQPVARHYLLYPNPSPKPAHLMRRWHAHPAWPAALSLGGVLTLRTNWRIYAEEFSRSLELHGLGRPPVVSFRPEVALTPFERKYAESGHALYELSIRIAS